MVHPSRSNEAGPLVVLAAQQYVAGRSAAFTADTTWRWFMEFRAGGVEGPYERFWGQLIRWLAGADTKSRDAAASVLLQLAPSRTVFAAGQSVTVDALVRGTKDDDVPSDVACKLVPAAGGEPLTLAMKPAKVKGRFTASFKPEKPGEFRLEAAAAGEDKKIVATDELPLIVTAARDAALAAETDPARLKPDRKLLERLAEASGGRHRDISQLAELVGEIRSRKAQGQEQAGKRPQTTVFPAYGSGTMGILFVVFVALLTCEWLVRRNWQLH